ncbi:MAG: NrfD/PsrC family molybdoenzyme membrane anchor subunit [Myxococcota bacterium]
MAAAASDALDEPQTLRDRSGDAELTDRLLAPLWAGGAGRSRTWRLLFLLASAGTAWLFFAMAWTFTVGIGAWGNQIPVAWAYAIINFVWWIGIGHAGTFISAFLLLLQQGWRQSINRVAEAMTLFAVMQAGLFPLLHLGRPWFFYFLIPYPATMGVWPQFRSALPWDAAAIGTYFTVSLLFWYTGLLPDLAAARDRAPSRARARIYGVFALGWTGSARDWSRHRIAYGLMAALATPLVISVHSIVSLDFAISNLPGWHSTIFPPYFVVGALYSGFAMVLTLLVPIRRAFELDGVITRRHLDALAKITLAMGLIITYSYVCEFFIAWYTGSPFERYTALFSRPFGTYAWVFWLMLACNLLTPHLFWSRWCRRTPWVLLLASIAIQIGMWTERFIIIVTSLERDFLPSSWRAYAPTWVDWSLLFGTICFFGLLFLLFLRFVPLVPVAEVKALRDDLEREAQVGFAPEARVGLEREARAGRGA